MSVCKDCRTTAIDFEINPPECTLCASTNIRVFTQKKYPDVDNIVSHSQYPCKWCGDTIMYGEPVYWRKKGNRYCSDACMDEWFYFQDLKKKGIVAISKSESTCAYCGNDIPWGWYHWYTRSYKYCSEDCFNSKKVRKNKGTITVKCEVCETDFIAAKKGQKYCSAHCSRIAGSKNWTKEHKDGFKTQKDLEERKKQNLTELHKSMANNSQ